MFSKTGLQCESPLRGSECGNFNTEYYHNFEKDCQCNPKEAVEWATSMMLLSKTDCSPGLKWYRNLSMALSIAFNHRRWWMIRIKRAGYSTPKSDKFIDVWRSMRWCVTWKYPVCFNHYMQKYDLFPVRDEFGYTFYAPPWLVYGDGKRRIKQPVKYAEVEKDIIPKDIPEIPNKG